MNDNSPRTDRTHNIVLIIISIACFGAAAESISQGWEFWVPPLILLGVVAAWFMHLTHRGMSSFRENYYMIFAMMVSFYHGVHDTSFFDVVVISMLLLITVAVLARKEFLIAILIEFFVLMGTQIYHSLKSGEITFDSLNISRIILHVMTEICAYYALRELINVAGKNRREISERNREKEEEKVEMDDFLVNISHELRTPVNVINGLSAIILKREDRADVESIRDAGRRLSRQIEDIQDYSEIQRGDVVLEEEKYMITSLINDVIANYKVRWSKKNLDLIVNLDPNVPSTMKGDDKKLSKVIRHLLSNAVKFTKEGGIYLKVSGVKREYGFNLVIEVTDTGIGISDKDIERIANGSYQTNKMRNRSSGGIGLGFPIVYGFVREMNGFVTIESDMGQGTTVRVCVAQEIINPQPCLVVDNANLINVAFHSYSEKYKVSQLRDFYRTMATDLAAGLRINLYSAPGIREMKKLIEQRRITHIFMGEEEYKGNSQYFDQLCREGYKVIIVAKDGFKAKKTSGIYVLSKPLFGCGVVRALSDDNRDPLSVTNENERCPVLDGVRALVVDDEPMNLVVATGLFKEYNMIIDTAGSGKEAIRKFTENDYDVIFMDHMMPEMDGIEAMKRIRNIAASKYKSIRIIALTANAISGAKEMFLREGFDGFISKPVDINDFERVMNRVMPGRTTGKGGIA